MTVLVNPACSQHSAVRGLGVLSADSWFGKWFLYFILTMMAHWLKLFLGSSIECGPLSSLLGSLWFSHRKSPAQPFRTCR